MHSDVNMFSSAMDISFSKVYVLHGFGIPFFIYMSKETIVVHSPIGILMELGLSCMIFDVHNFVTPKFAYLGIDWVLRSLCWIRLYPC